MGAIFERFQRERDEQVKSRTIEQTAKVLKMLKEGIELKEISNEIGFSVEQIKLLQKAIKD